MILMQQIEEGKPFQSCQAGSTTTTITTSTTTSTTTVAALDWGRLLFRWWGISPASDSTWFNDFSSLSRCRILTGRPLQGCAPYSSMFQTVLMSTWDCVINPLPPSCGSLRGTPPINQPELVHYIEIDFLYITNYYDIYYATTVIFQLL